PGRYQDLVLRGADHLVSVGRPFAARIDELERFDESSLRSSVLGRARMAFGAFGEAKVLLESAWEQLSALSHGREDEAAATIAEAMAVISISSLDPDAVVM